MKTQLKSSPGVNFIDYGADAGFEELRGVPDFTRAGVWPLLLEQSRDVA